MDRIIVDERMASAAELVPEGAVLLDVGTDHGYLPAKLLLDGKISAAGASDINEGPLAKAVATAEKYGIKDRMSFYLSDGLLGIPDLEKYSAVSICGMGGELIARIISEAEYLKRERVSLVLQPMSSSERLSEYLAEEGFNITEERIAFAAGKVYRVISAVYDGNVHRLSPAEHIIGRYNIKKGTSQKNFRILIGKYILKYKRLIEGKRAGGVDVSEDEDVLRALLEIVKREGISNENS